MKVFKLDLLASKVRGGSIPVPRKTRSVQELFDESDDRFNKFSVTWTSDPREQRDQEKLHTAIQPIHDKDYLARQGEQG